MSDRGANNKDGHEPHATVNIVVDGTTFSLRPGKWLVSELKATVGVDPAKVLAEITPHGLVDLEDSGHTEVHEGSRLMSHARSGSAS
jgi:hypothetical protein